MGAGSVTRHMNGRQYLQANSMQAKYLNHLLKATVPAIHAKLIRAAAAGRWFQELNDRPFLGMATVWKLQVGVHLDESDWELCVITCGGAFTGGHLYLPDLNLCLL